MKKLLSLILVISLALAACLPIYAQDSTYVYELGGKTVIFDEATQFSAEQRENIVNLLANGTETEDSETYGLMCTLFGHKYVEESVKTITHCVSDTQPRCFEEVFDIGECSRCGKTYANRISYQYIYCCE